jgi:EpsD family peptidyl-prolyl cis-trans isomerase
MPPGLRRKALPSRAIFGLGLIIAALAASGCGRSGETAGSASPSQVAARVNGTEITIPQLNHELARLGASAAKDQIPVVLDRLVDQTLLVQRAEAARLERNPEVLQALESARQAVLADAWLRQVTAVAAEPSDREISAYYSANPQFFSQRRAYGYRSIVVTAPPQVVATLKPETTDSNPLTALESRLRSENITFVSNVYSKTTEQIPPAVRATFLSLPKGGTAAFPFEGGVEFVELLDSRPEPISEANANAPIRRFLADQKRRDLATKEMRSLHESAAIEYLGDFVGHSRRDTPDSPAP